MSTSPPTPSKTYPLPLPPSFQARNRESYHHADMRGAWAPPPSQAIGVELELEANNSTLVSTVCGLAHHYGFAAESDGSLRSEVGIEIVGPPLDISEYNSQNYTNNPWYKFLDHIKGRARGWSASTSNNTYGMHVSVNLSSLTPAQAARFQRFWCNYPNFVAAYAGRSENTYCRYFFKPENTTAPTAEDGGRYEAAALRGNNRLEIRIFRSTIDITGFFKNIDIVRAAFSLAHNTTGEITPTAFLNSVTSSPDHYPSLMEWMSIKKRFDKLRTRADSYLPNATATPTTVNNVTPNPIPQLTIAEPIAVTPETIGPETISQYVARVLTAIGIGGGIQVHTALVPITEDSPIQIPPPITPPTNEPETIPLPPPDPTFVGLYEIINSNTLAPINGTIPTRLNLETALNLRGPTPPTHLFIYPIAWGTRDSSRASRGRSIGVTIPLEPEFVDSNAHPD